MSGLSPVTLVLNGFALALALGFMFIVLWYDSRKRVIQFYATFMLMVTLWNLGALMAQALALLPANNAITSIAFSLTELGYSGASVALYIFLTLLSGTHVRRFSLLAFLSLGVLIAYRLFLLLAASPTSAVDEAPPLATFSIVFFVIFDLLSLYLGWLYRRKIRDALMVTGVVVFVTGQGVALLNPELGIVALATVISSLGALMISVAIVRQEIITPITSLTAQLNTTRGVSMSISSQLDPGTILSEITVQSARLSGADAVGLFLRERADLELVNVYNLPDEMRHMRVEVGRGLIGRAAEMQTSLYIENYGRDWKGEDDLKYARSTFGAVVCVPLRYREEVIGVLLVVSGKQGRLFRREEIQVLELLGAQAAVALAHTRLFDEVESARSTLETLLNSTENPVVAFDAAYNLIFANPAALNLTTLNAAIREHRIHELLLPNGDAPENVYEIKLDERDYLCHLGRLGSVQLEGWVAVMQDVTQLKELDRMKSEMVRMVSHDLKNPLMGALLYIDLLRETASSAQNEMLTVIEQQMDRMQRIIRGVLDVEKVRLSSVLSEPVMVKPLVERAMTELRRQADSKQILFEAENPDDTLCFIGDADQFQRALVNLMENAIKFSDDGGRVTVRAYRDGEQIVFCVEDDGIGIPPELHDRVFDRFFRGRQQGAEHVAGSGLGLSIVKTIAENHRGRVWLENVDARGTRVFITVPAGDSGGLDVQLE